MRSPDRPPQILRQCSTKFTNKKRAKGLIWESMHTCLSHPIQSIKDTLPAIILPTPPYAGVTAALPPKKLPETPNSQILRREVEGVRAPYSPSAVVNSFPPDGSTQPCRRLL